MNEPKQYAPASVKEITTTNGKLMKLSFSAAKLAAWAAERANEKGYVNLCITPRREVGQYGETHTVWLDTWKPAGAPQAAPRKPSIADNDDIPF